MSYYDEDFYYEPSEFDIQVMALKESLAKSIKDDFIAELDRLKTENNALQDIKTNFEKIKNDFRSKERQLELERNDLERKIRRERLSSLMKDFEVIMYRAYSKRELPSKCNKCDENRRINYKTPLGKDTYEECDCNNGETVYYPEEYICSEFRINNDGNAMSAWYKLKPSREYDYVLYDSSTYAKVVYNENLKYENIERYDTFFKTKEECQGYCDWLNANK